MFFIFQLSAQNLNDDFEGNGNIASWYGDSCGLNINFLNPYQTGINTSPKVLRYADNGGQYANVGFNNSSNFVLSNNTKFTLKIYVPSSGITGNQPNQISLKLQNNTLAQPWTTQSEIIKPIVLNQWQIVTFNFATDNFVNLDPNSPNPVLRNDFNRVLLQVNGENNTNQVIALIDDFLFDEINVFNNLVWSDEFDTNGDINALKWHRQTQLIAGNSWANGEVQHYTNRLANSNVSNGNLNIIAKKETFTDQGQTKQYTSARLNSKFTFKYGRVEARAKMPTGVGTFPAIWMLGKNIIEPGSYWSSSNGSVYWPNCGEIDIIEHWGNNQDFVQSAIHTPSSFGNTVNYGGQLISGASTQFHIYALEWTAEKLVFSVDNVIHYVYNPAVKNANTWPFDADQFLLLNSAVLPNITSSFIQSTMEIDYVRVYQAGNLINQNYSLENNFKIYPNPANDKINIQVDNNLKNTKLKISSVLGQELKLFSINQQLSTIDISEFSNGIYLIEIQNDKGSEVFKVIKN